MYTNSDKRYKSRVGVNLTILVSGLYIDKSIAAEDNFSGFQNYKNYNKIIAWPNISGQERTKLLW